MPYDLKLMLWASIICLFLAVVLVLIPSLIDQNLLTGAVGQSIWIYWLDVFSGNWNAKTGVVTPRTFAFSACLSVLLNNSLIVTLPLLAWRLIVQRRERMVLAQAVAVRDALTKQEVLSALNVDPQNTALKKQITEAFSRVDRQWREYLSNVFGEERARKIRDILDSDI